MNERTQTDSKGELDDTPLFSRTPTRDIFGPLDDSLPEVRINGDVKLDAVRAAHAAGLDLSGWIRERVCVALYGAEHIGNLYAARARRVQGNARQERPAITLPVVDSMPSGEGR